MQTRKQSLIEAISNTFIGLIVSATANYLVLPLFYEGVNVKNCVAVSIIFTVISIIRNYIVRRWFNVRNS